MYGSSCNVETTVSRPTASSYMLVDSLDRYGNAWPTNTTFTTSSDWSLNFQSPVINGQIARLALTQVGFQWNIPTILFNYNDRFQIGVVGGVGGPQTITITPGYYTPALLATEIQTRLVIAFPLLAITCVYNSVFGSFVIDSGSLLVNLAILPAQSGFSATARRTQRTLLTLGFLNVAGANTLTPTIFGNIPTMVATRWLDICSSFLTKYQRIKDGTTLLANPRQDILTRIFAVAPNTRYEITANDSPGSSPWSMVQDMNNPKYIEWSSDEAITNFDIQVRDEFGDIMPVQQGFCSEYQISFLVVRDS